MLLSASLAAVSFSAAPAAHLGTRVAQRSTTVQCVDQWNFRHGTGGRAIGSAPSIDRKQAMVQPYVVDQSTTMEEPYERRRMMVEPWEAEPIVGGAPGTTCTSQDPGGYAPPRMGFLDMALAAATGRLSAGPERGLFSPRHTCDTQEDADADWY